MAQKRRDEIYGNRWYRAGPAMRPNEPYQLPQRRGQAVLSLRHTSRHQARSRESLLKPDDGTGRLTQNLERLSLTSGVTRKNAQRTTAATWQSLVRLTAKKIPSSPAPPPWKEQEDIINHQIICSKRPAASVQKARKSSSSSSSNVERPRYVLGLGFTIHERVPVKPAQTLVPIEEKENDSSSDEADSVLSDSALPLPEFSEDELERELAPDDTSDDEEEVRIIPHVPPPQLKSLLDPLRPSHRLPFLPRNLRAGFLRACRKAGVKTTRPFTSSPPDIDVIFTYHTEQGKSLSYSTTMRGWCCPLCKEQGLGAFATQHMLLAHLKWDHSEFEVKCSQVFNFYDAPKDRPTFRLQLTLPPRPLTPIELPLSPATIEASRSPSTTPIPDNNEATIQLPPDDLPTVYPSTGVVVHGLPPEISRETSEESQLSTEQTDTSYVPDDSRGPSLETSGFGDSTAESTPVPTVRKPTRKKKALAKSLVQRAPSLDTSTGGFGDSGSEWTPVPTLRRSTRLVQKKLVKPPVQRPLPELDEDDTESDVPERPCTPPPIDAPLGPAAVYPYVPFKSFDRGQDIEYSCRPTGAQLCDLVGALSTKKFGVLAWDVITQEEEIFESEDYTDEQKVIHALWARWIFLNKHKFIGSYFEGTKIFIDEYWKIIHYAAGHRALCWLLYHHLAKRQLTSREIVDLVRFYEEKTGMKDWYTELEGQNTPAMNS